MLRYCWLVLALVSAMMLLGCGGGAPRVQPAGLSALPAPSALLRSASYSEFDRQQDGAQYIEDLTDVFSVDVNGTAVEFHPDYPGGGGLDSVSYAGYGFALDGYDGAATLNLAWGATPPNAGDLWIALSNWRTDSWKWFQLNNINQLSLSPLSDYFEAGTGRCYAVIAITGQYSDPAWPVLNTIRIGDEIVVQQPPAAVLSADNIDGAPPLDVNFTAAQSSDSDGSITLYELDKNGDGTYEESSPTAPAWTQHFSTEGRFTVALRVTDDDGNTDTDQVVVNTAADSGWVGVNIPGLTTPGAPVWDADGLPLVAYSKGVYLSCIRAQNTLGQTWDSPVDIYYSGSGGCPCATSINGRPALAFETSGGNGFSLQYVTAKNAAGTEWNEPYYVCKGPAVMQDSGQPQLFELNGMPAIVYQTDEPYGSRNLFCYRALDPQGHTWDEGTLIGPDNVVGSSRVRYINTLPAVAFVWHNDAENRYELGFSIATDENASDWGMEVQILALAPGSPGDVCYGLDLIQAGDAPAVAYCVGPIPSGAKTLYFLTADNAAGSSWTGVPVSLYVATGTFDFLKWPRLEMIAGSPAVLFEEWSPSTFGRLAYMRATDSAGASWGALEEVARVESGVMNDYEPYSRYLTLGMSGGLPAVVTICGTEDTQQCIFYTRR